MKLLRAVAAIALAVSLSGCASLAHSVVTGLYGDSPYTKDAVKAVGISMAAYDKTIQPQIERYGHWPKAGTPGCAALKTTLLCRNEQIWGRLKQGDAFAAPAIHKARLIVDGLVPDDDGASLTAAADAIRQQEEAYVAGTTPGVVP